MIHEDPPTVAAMAGSLKIGLTTIEAEGAILLASGGREPPGCCWTSQFQVDLTPKGLTPPARQKAQSRSGGGA